MTDSMHELGATEVLGLFQELSDHLAISQTHAQLFVVGGAAMALAYDSRRSTRDVDALLLPTSEVRAAAETIAEAHGLEPDWLNDAMKGFLPGNDREPVTVFETEWLLVQIPSPEYLLAMKLYASRDETDIEDAVTLFHILNFSTAEEAINLLANTYSVERLLPRHRYAALEVAERASSNTNFPKK